MQEKTRGKHFLKNICEERFRKTSLIVIKGILIKCGCAMTTEVTMQQYGQQNFN